jgi:hypothetical protein
MRADRQLRLDVIVGGVVLLVYAAVQLWLLLGPQPFDPTYYFDLAVPFPPDAANYWTLRIGLIVPVRVAISFLGASEAAMYAIPLAAGLLLVGAVYGTVLSLFRDRVLASGAALVTGLSPLWLLSSSFIFPDTVATATFTAGILCLVLGRPRPDRDARGWSTTALVIGAGILFGWTYLVREFSPILLPAVIATVVFLGYRLRALAFLAATAVATLAVELLYGQLAYGDPFVRAHVLLDRGERHIQGPRKLLMQRITDDIDNPVDSLLVFPRLLLDWNVGWIFLVLLGIFIVGLVLFRDDRLWMFAVWCFGFWAVMGVLGLVRLESGELVLNVTNIRYWYPIFPPLVMGAFGSLSLMLRTHVARRAVWLIPVIPAVLAAGAVVPGTLEFQSCASRDLWRNETAERWNELRSWLSRPEAENYRTIWADNVSGRLAPVFTRTTFGSTLWHGNVKRIVAGRPVILVNKRFQPVGLDDLRTDWTPVFESEDGWILLLKHLPSGVGRGGSEDWWQSRTRPVVGDAGECGLSEFQPFG